MTTGPENGLALLTAVFPGTETDVIAHALKQARGDVQGASAILLEPPRGKRALDEWLGREPKRAKPRRAPTLVKGSSTQLPSAFDRLVPPVDLPPPAPTLSPLLLTTPVAVHKATDGRCTLIENVLPREDAARLYLSSVHDSIDGAGWETNKWTLFDREVESPHTTSFFVEGVRSGGGGGYDQLAFAEAAKYWYNGEQREAKVFNAEMDKARAVIGPLVRAVMHERTPESPLQWDGDWEPNVAAANCYRGKSQSVGWHSDVLSYLGPFPTIASLSLGVSRPFRLKPVVPALPPGSIATAPPRRTLAIQLPHNSLLIMHAGTQEFFKHEIPAITAGMDLFKLPKGCGFADALLARGWNERINMTFRHYRPDFAPLPSSSSGFAPRPGYAGTPICACGVPCSLRPDARGKVKASREAQGKGRVDDSIEEEMIFFWTCNAGGQAEGKTCQHWQLLDFQKEGRGKYFDRQHKQ